MIESEYTMPPSTLLSGIYMHLPFCRKICPFCGFAVLRDDENKKNTYLKLLEQELALLTKSKPCNFEQLKSIYIGGGTPSLFPITQLDGLMRMINQYGPNPAKPQWSIEVNPEDVTQDYAKSLFELGFRRVSVGVQSLNSHSLKTLGRPHTNQQSIDAINHLKSAGFQNINLDLMFAYRNQSLSGLSEDLEHFIDYSPTHLSVYSLTIEPKTKINRQSSWKSWQTKNEHLIANMYELIVNTLKANGFEQYEVSNFARYGYQSAQNLINWTGENYLGIGIGAQSHINGSRWGNARRWADYKQKIESDQLPHVFFETLDDFEKRNEYLMIQLRLSKGVDRHFFKRHFKIDIFKACQKEINTLKAKGLLTVIRDRIVLTTKGLLLADEIALYLTNQLPG